MLTTKQKEELMRIPLMKEIKKNYMFAQSGAGRKKRMKGRGWWDDVGNWFKQAGTDVDAWLKKTGALSKLGSAVTALGAIPGFQEFLPIGGAIKAVGSTLGYGRKMRGGDSRLSINPMGQRLIGRLTVASNGTFQTIPYSNRTGMIGRGSAGGSAFGTVSSFGNAIKV